MGFLSKIGLGFIEDALQWVLGIEEPDAPSTVVNKQSNIEPLPVIYGERKVGGTRVFVSTGGNDNKYLYIALALCEGEIDSIGDIYINDVLSTDSKFSGKFTVQKYLGSDTQTATSLFNDADTNWTSAHRLRGVAYLAMRFTYDQDVYSGIPEVKAIVRGRKVYDPRQDSTSTYYDSSVGVSTQRQNDSSTWKWSSNNAICLRDYLTNARFGKGLPTSAINDATFVQAADDCDDIVTSYSGGPDISLFSCNGIFATDQTVFDNVKRFLANMRGIMSYSYGQYKLAIDKPQSSTFDLTPDNILSDISIASNSKNKKYNKVTAKFTNPNANWQDDVAVWPPAGSEEETAFLEADNNQELAHEFTLHNTTNYYAARDLARIVCLASRDAGLSIELTATSEAFAIAAGDVVRIEQPSLGWTGAARKLARVSSVQLNDNGEVDLVMQEYSASVYTWAVGSEQPDSPETTLPDPFTIAPPTNLTTTAGVVIGDDGTTRSYIDLSWTAANDAFVTQYQVTITPSGENAQTIIVTNTNYRYFVVNTGVTHDFEIRSINSLGVRSTGLTTTGVNATVDTIAPNAPTNATVTGTFKQIELAWDNPTDDDFKYIEIKRAGTTVEGDAVVIATTAGDSYVDGNYTGIVTRYYWLRAVDYTGNASAWISAGGGTTQHLVTDDFDDGIISIDHFDIATQNTINTKASQTTVDNINANLTTLESDVDGIIDEQQNFDDTLNTVATRMLTLATDQSEWLGIMRDAGITVDPNNGTVTIQAVETAKTELNASINQVQIDLDAAEAEILLKASTSYVNNAIAAAVLDSADLASLNALEAQVNQAEIDIDANTASIALKADITTVNGLDVRLTQAEVDIDAAESQIALKASTSDFNNLESRVTTAETTINGLDVASITQSVIETNSIAQGLELSATTTLRDVLNQYKTRENTKTDLAYTQTQITADVNEQRQAIATARTELGALIDDANASIISEATTRANADSALASDINALQASIDTNTASIQTEQTTRADADTALAADITSLSATVDQNTADIATEQTTRADADTALSNSITALTATVDDNTTAITTEQTARVDGDNALASDITDLQSDITDLETDTSANATAITNLDTRVTSAENTITSQSNSITDLQSDITDLETNTSANATAITSLNTTVTQHGTDISSNASSITSLTTTVNGHTTSISTNTTSIDGIKAQYSVTINNNGHVSGYGLVSDIIDGNPTSSFTVNADSFGIGATGATDQYPFVVYTASQQINKNGTTYTIPAGTYIADAFIQNAAIGTAEIQNLGVTTLKIDDNAVTIPSSVYTAAFQSFAYTAGEVTLQTLTVNSSGATTEILGSVRFVKIGGSITNNYIPITLRIKRGSTTIRTYTDVRIPANNTVSNETLIVASTTPTSGSQTYTLTAEITGGEGNVRAFDRYLRTLETKK